MPVPPNRIVPFEKLSGRGILVAVVDTGIDPSHPAVGSVRAGTGLATTETGKVSLSTNFLDDFGHGTACAALIRRIAPDCDLMAVKITNGRTPIPPSSLAEGILWAVSNGAHVISVSVGTAASSGRGSEGLVAACRHAEAAGAILLAAESNDGSISFPAALETAIAVAAGEDNRGPHDYVVDPSDRRRFIAYGGYQRVAWLEPRYLFLSGASFAAARMAGIAALAREHCGSVSREEFLDILAYNVTHRGSSNRGHRAPTRSVVSRDAAELTVSSRSIDSIRRASVFPFSKEVHSLVRFRHLLPFELVSVSDIAGRRTVGKDSGTLLGLPTNGLVVSARLEEAMESADTLILGFTSRLGQLQRREVGTDILARALRAGKNVYSFEPFLLPHHGDLLTEAAERRLRIAWPALTYEDLLELRRSVREPVDYHETPILGIFGTSPSQGKFTLQVLLGNALRTMGYRVAQIGTEHQSLLFGMVDCFPSGHVSNVFLRPPKWREYFHLRYQQLKRDMDPDIIIIGSQGGIVPFSLSHSPLGPATSYALLFLMAIRADVYFLTVNHEDDDRMIQDSIDLLRILGKGRTVLLALSTLRKRLSRSYGRVVIHHESVPPPEQEETLRRLEARFRLPAVSILDPEGPNRLVEIVQSAYGGK
jgi:uncharacterized NAD-dependent epimerase/dehydratase family protein